MEFTDGVNIMCVVIVSKGSFAIRVLRIESG